MVIRMQLSEFQQQLDALVQSAQTDLDQALNADAMAGKRVALPSFTLTILELELKNNSVTVAFKLTL